MLQHFYSALPIPLQHACATAQGAKYYRWRYGGVFQGYLEKLRRSEHLPAEQLRQLQTVELDRLRRFVVMHVPHYRKHGPAVLTTKDQIQERPEDFIADTFPRRALIPWHTSGTTGKALTVYYNRQAMQKMWAFVELYRNTAGVAKDDRRGQFTGKMIVPPEQAASKKIFWRRDLANHALLLSTVHLLPANLPCYAAALERFRPVYLSGYPSSMYVLAEYYRQSGRPAPRFKAALTSTENVLEHQRRAIEETFATRVFDQHGQAEMQNFWYECEAGRMHAHPLSGLTEILHPDGAPAALGEMGEVVLTGLVNDAMPLLRYHMGDAARFATESCPCGRGMRSSRRSAAGLTISSIPASAVFGGAWIRCSRASATSSRASSSRNRWTCCASASCPRRASPPQICKCWKTTSAPAWGGAYIWSLNAPIVFRARRTGSSGL